MKSAKIPTLLKKNQIMECCVVCGYNDNGINSNGNCNSINISKTTTTIATAIVWPQDIQTDAEQTIGIKLNFNLCLVSFNKNKFHNDKKQTNQQIVFKQQWPIKIAPYVS